MPGPTVGIIILIPGIGIAGALVPGAVAPALELAVATSSVTGAAQPALSKKAITTPPQPLRLPSR